MSVCRSRNSPEQRALGLGVARVELPHLGVEQVVEEERRRSARGLRAWHRPDQTRAAARLPRATHNVQPISCGVGEDAGLDGFVFGGYSHVPKPDNMHNSK